MIRYLFSEQIPDVPDSLYWRYFQSLDDAMFQMYNKYLKYIFQCETHDLHLFEEVDGERTLLCSVQCCPVFHDHKEVSL